MKKCRKSYLCAQNYIQNLPAIIHRGILDKSGTMNILENHCVFEIYFIKIIFGSGGDKEVIHKWNFVAAAITLLSEILLGFSI